MSFLACLFYCDVVISDFGNPSCQPQVCGAAKAKPAKPPTEKERSLMQTSLLGLDIKDVILRSFDATTKKWQAWQVFKKSSIYFLL